MRLVLRRTRIALAATALPLALLAGCSGSKGTDSAKDSASSDTPSAADSSDSSEESPAADLTEGSQVSGAELADILTKGQAGKEPFAYSMDIGDGTKAKTVRAVGVMDPSGDEMRMSFTMKLGTQKIESRIIGNDMYMKLGPKWMKSPLDSATEQQSDPRAQMSQFAEAIDTATYEGTETLDGEQVEHYSADLDASALADAGIKDSVKNMQLDFFIDGDHRLTMMDIEADGMSMKYDLYDFGKSVTIEAPPAAQVVSQ